ncbi:hypothetical protein [Bdellovibrio bacteriovorus]|nr:hypothetical protein [Bdellovibrio bacteriovorus]
MSRFVRARRRGSIAAALRAVRAIVAPAKALHFGLIPESAPSGNR